VSAGVRRVLLVLGVLALAAAAAAAGLAVARSGGARGYPVDQLPEGVSGATLQVTPAFVYRRGATVIVLRPFAPDSPIPVGWCPEQGFFEDPETGSKFGPEGAYLAGPATRGLDRLRSTVVNGVLQVAPGDVTAGAARGHERSATSEPRCDWASAIFAPGVAPPPSPTPEPGPTG
jgi:hypothetical protein